MRGLFVLLALAGCSSIPSAGERYQLALEIAAQAGLQPEVIKANGLALQTFHKGLDRPGLWHIYVEGDGLAFTGRRLRSNDPTPVNPLALKLAARDPAFSVLYLARPCQYTQRMKPDCDPSLWTNARFSDRVSATMKKTLDVLSGNSRPRITLIGYSGGGVIAALWAKRDTRIERLVTVASPLDTAAWTRHHKLTALDQSLNPADEQLPAWLVQHHFLGAKDAIVPPGLAAPYAQARNVPSTIIETFDHHCCWTEAWPDLLNQLPMPGVNQSSEPGLH